MNAREMQELLMLINFIKPKLQDAAGQLVVQLNHFLQLVLDAGFEKIEEKIEGLQNTDSRK